MALIANGKKILLEAHDKINLTENVCAQGFGKQEQHAYAGINNIPIAYNALILIILHSINSSNIRHKFL